VSNWSSRQVHRPPAFGVLLILSAGSARQVIRRGARQQARPFTPQWLFQSKRMLRAGMVFLTGLARSIGFRTGAES
jgi:hypothetical protein